MEIDESLKSNIKCFKSHVQCLGPLNIDYNASSTTFILWNKYEIYVYENLKFEAASKVILPAFHIFYLVSSNNFIICLDFEGNIYTTCMKFKQSAPKRLKTNFVQREKCVLSTTLYTSEKVLSLKFEHNTHHLWINNLNSEFELEKKIKLTFPNENNQPSQCELNSCILKCYKLDEKYDNLLRIFNTDRDVTKDYNLIIISFDRRVLYGSLLSQKMQTNEMALQNIFSSPTRINDIKLIEENLGYILITLESGTIVKLSLADLNKNSDIVHLNTAISKCVPFHESILYTDGITMWKSNNTFTKDINFQQFHINQVKDFVCFGDQILCTTFTNLIYLITVDNEIFIKSTSEYCEAKKILNDTGCVYKILDRVEVNYELEKKIKEECDFITALSLSNRPDILDSIIIYSILLYNNYEDVLKECHDLTLTDNVREFFTTNILCLLIRISLTFEKHKINNVLLQVLRDLQIHITLLSSNKLIKTTSVRVVDEFKNINLVIPFNSKHSTSVTVNIKILKRIPGMQSKEEMWILMHEKEIILNAEHFIKSNILKNNITELKNVENSVEGIINQIAFNSSSHLFKFTSIENKTKSEFSFYLKLPDNCKEAFENENYYRNIFNTEKALNILKHNTSDDFLKGKNNITFEIGNTKVNIEIINDFTDHSLKVTCDDMKIGFDMRNFYCNLAYDNFSKCEPGKEFVRHTLYATIENIQKGIRCCISRDTDDLKPLLEQLQRFVYGAMPL
ncbi:PREDICTED: uncharacterized protein LOC106108727 [Papilio polytes]|uniref:uncharacterized protein LOC106108727 n=1 Tax=Papilio polytes TaxID=76194 RepID=UPI000675EFE9|nr:PREDICTED: uncharacterized protein LOC106108727 [Papilio polytes]